MSVRVCVCIGFCLWRENARTTQSHSFSNFECNRVTLDEFDTGKICGCHFIHIENINSEYTKPKSCRTRDEIEGKFG